MSIFNVLAGLVKPVTELVDELHVSAEEKAQLRNQLYSMQSQVGYKLLEHERDVMRMQADVVKAEAQGQSWMQRSWRPITMLTFLILVCCDVFGLLAFRLSDEAWTLLQIGLGGYVVGRSAEKIAPKLVDAMRERSAAQI